MLDYQYLKTTTLNFLDKMKVNDTIFLMSKESEATIFSSIFALYIYILLGETKNWSIVIKGKWIDHINSFQDRKSGLYIPSEVYDHNSKPVYQLTAFALSALGALNGNPKYELGFIKRWKTKTDIKDFLNESGCWKGQPGSGNTAMFLAIFLTYEYERTNNPSYLELINVWFEEHDKNQNRDTGFWEESPVKNFYNGFQNGLHQHVIYNYWNRKIYNSEKIVDQLLKLQANDGTFYSYLGGYACYEYDAIYILINGGLQNNYKTKEIYNALNKTLFTITKLHNKDGGFCENNKHPNKLQNILSISTMHFILFAPNINTSYFRIKSTILQFIRKNDSQKTHFSIQPIPWEVSDMWSTWFRLQTIAEIETVLEPEKGKWVFHKHIGLGYNK